MFSCQVPYSFRYPPVGLVLTNSSSTIKWFDNITSMSIIFIDMFHLTCVFYCYSKPRTYSSTYCRMDGMHQEVFDSVTPL